MLKRLERSLRVYAPAEGGEGELLGYYPMSVSYRTAEEVESGDMRYTNLRLTGFADRNRSPEGGYRRGMVITDDSGAERYHVLVPVAVEKMWILKLEQVLMGGDFHAG